MQGLKIDAIVGSVGRFINLDDKILSIRGFADVDQDETIADGVVEISRIEKDGLLAHAYRFVVLVRITGIEIGRNRVGRGESRIHLDDFIEFGERVRGAGGTGDGARTKHGCHVIRQIVRRSLRDSLDEFGFGGFGILFRIPGEEAESFVGDGGFWIGGEGLVEGGFGFDGALGIDEEDATQGLRFGEGERAAEVGLGVVVDAELQMAHVETLLLGAGFHDLRKLFEIAKGLLRGFDLIVGGVPGVEEVGEELALPGVCIEHEVVEQSPGLRIENGSAVLLVVIWGVLVYLEKCFDGNEFVGAKDVQVTGGDFTDLHLLVADLGVAELFGEAFVHPKRKIAEIETDESVGVFVVDDLIGILALDVGANDDKIALLAGNMETGGMRVAFDLPISGKDGFDRVFVFQGEDEDGFAKVCAEVGEGGVEDFADLFKLGSDAAGFVFTAIADHGEVGGTDFDPVVEVIGGG